MHDGSTYSWNVIGGSLASGQGSAAVLFNSGDPGTTMLVEVTETNITCVLAGRGSAVQVDFVDVPPTHIFHDFVNTIARDGVTAGCGAARYCPDNAEHAGADGGVPAQVEVRLRPRPAARRPGSSSCDVPATDPFARLDRGALPPSASPAAAAAETTARRPGHARADGGVPPEDARGLELRSPAGHGHDLRRRSRSARSGPTGSRISTAAASPAAARRRRCSTARTSRSRADRWRCF